MFWGAYVFGFDEHYKNIVESIFDLVYSDVDGILEDYINLLIL